MQHVKPHGALFNMAVRNAELSDAIARAVAAFDASLILFGLPGSEILNAGRAAGLRVAAEVFADRAYEPDGSLASRRKPGPSSTIPTLVVARAVRMVKERTVVAIDGSVVAARGRHHLRARRHAGLGRPGRENPRRPRSRRHHSESDRPSDHALSHPPSPSATSHQP